MPQLKIVATVLLLVASGTVLPVLADNSEKPALDEPYQVAIEVGQIREKGWPIHWPSTRRGKYPRNFDGNVSGEPLEVSEEGKYPPEDYSLECMSRHKRSTRHRGKIDSCPKW